MQRVRLHSWRGISLHHDDQASLENVQHEVSAMQTQLRAMLTAALCKEADVRNAFLVWIAAVLMAAELALRPLNADPRRVPLVPRASDACLVNLSAVIEARGSVFTAVYAFDVHASPVPADAASSQASRWGP